MRHHTYALCIHTHRATREEINFWSVRCTGLICLIDTLSCCWYPASHARAHTPAGSHASRLLQQSTAGLRMSAQSWCHPPALFQYARSISIRACTKWLQCNEWLCGCTQSCDTDSAWEYNALKPPFPLRLSHSLRAPLRPAASQPRDQLQALMKRQSGNWGAGGGGPARQGG